MFDVCPKIGRTCPFATKSSYNIHTGVVDKDTYTYCGLATGCDNRAEYLPKCWKDMTKYEQTKYRKNTHWRV